MTSTKETTMKISEVIVVFGMIIMLCVLLFAALKDIHRHGPRPSNDYEHAALMMLGPPVYEPEVEVLEKWSVRRSPNRVMTIDGHLFTFLETTRNAYDFNHLKDICRECGQDSITVAMTEGAVR